MTMGGLREFADCDIACAQAGKHTNTAGCLGWDWEEKLVADVVKARRERAKRQNNHDANLDGSQSPQWPKEDEVEDYEQWQWSVINGDTLMGFRDWLKDRGLS